MSAALSTYKNQVSKMKDRLASVARRAREESETIMDTAVTIGASAAFGALDQKYGSDALMGASIPLVVGVAATGAALLGYGGGMSDSLLAVGRAGLSCEAYRWGARTYQEWDASPAST